jgi:hypothetical protein
MTQAPRPVFHPVSATAEVSDEELARFSASQGVRTLVKPAAQASAVAQEIAQDAPIEPARTPPVPKKGAATKKTAAPAPPQNDLKLSVMVPRYVGKALRQRAVDDDCTVRHLVLRGLQAIGIDVKEADLNPDARLYRKDAS